MKQSEKPVAKKRVVAIKLTDKAMKSLVGGIPAPPRVPAVPAAPDAPALD